MDHLERIAANGLKNRYFVLRHGTSLANKAGIILSDPADGTTSYGLAAEGRDEVRRSAQAALDAGLLGADTVIISSDFIRAHETAEIAREALGAKPVIIDVRLRERHFGGWDKTHNSNYQKVWDDDVRDPAHTVNKVESATSVLQRTTGLITDLERRYSGRDVLLVSHGDALQILQTGFEKVSPSLHRSLPHLKTAEIRGLALKK